MKPCRVPTRDRYHSHQRSDHHQELLKARVLTKLCGKLDEKPVAGGLDLAARLLGQDAAHEAPMFLQQVQRERLFVPSKRSVANHVSEHNGSASAVFLGAAHWSRPIIFTISLNRGSWRN